MRHNISPVVPEGELLWRAVKWIGEQDNCNQKVIEEACIRFDLSPKDEEFLMRQFLQGKRQTDRASY